MMVHLWWINGYCNDFLRTSINHLVLLLSLSSSTGFPKWKKYCYILMNLSFFQFVRSNFVNIFVWIFRWMLFYIQLLSRPPKIVWWAQTHVYIFIICTSVCKILKKLGLTWRFKLCSSQITHGCTMKNFELSGDFALSMPLGCQERYIDTPYFPFQFPTLLTFSQKTILLEPIAWCILINATERKNGLLRAYLRRKSYETG